MTRGGTVGMGKPRWEWEIIHRVSRVVQVLVLVYVIRESIGLLRAFDSFAGNLLVVRVVLVFCGSQLCRNEHFCLTTFICSTISQNKVPHPVVLIDPVHMMYILPKFENKNFLLTLLDWLQIYKVDSTARAALTYSHVYLKLNCKINLGLSNVFVCRFDSFAGKLLVLRVFSVLCGSHCVAGSCLCGSLTRLRVHCYYLRVLCFDLQKICRRPNIGSRRYCLMEIKQEDPWAGPHIRRLPKYRPTQTAAL